LCRASGGPAAASGLAERGIRIVCLSPHEGGAGGVHPPRRGYHEDPEPGMHKVSIKPEAAKLLVAAAGDPHGLVTRMRLINGDHISAGGRNFVSENSPRETARWKAALDQLIQYGLIRDRGYKGEVFEVTDEGYSAVDQINVSELDSSAEEPA